MPVSQRELTNLLQVFVTMQYQGQLEELDHYFSTIDVHTVSSSVVVSIIKITHPSFANQSKYREWFKLIERARVHYNDQSEGRGDRVLRGIIIPSSRQ